LRKPLGVYIHIPFCARKCNYCDFLSGPADEVTRKNYVEMLCREIDLYKTLLIEVSIHFSLTYKGACSYS